MNSAAWGHPALWALVVFLGVSTGGGLYEWRCVYPLWSANAEPQSLKRRIEASGQGLAGRRFWPFVSPPVLLLSIANVVAAYDTSDPIRLLWLAGATMALADKLATFGYFAPTMILQFERAEKIAPEKLRRSVARWVRLSPIRIAVGFAALLTLLWAGTHFAP